MNSKSRSYTLVFMQFSAHCAAAVVTRDRRSPYGAASQIVGVFGVGLIALGSGVLLVSFIGLGNSLTALAIPKDNGTLVTHGIYSRVRHPIYFGLLVMSLGVMLDAGYWPQVIVVMLLYVLLGNKADFEETMLRERYPAVQAIRREDTAVFPEAR